MHQIKTKLVAILALLLCACSGNKSAKEAELASDSWKEITPKELDVNIFKQLQDDWMILSAGKEGDMNMMTIAWGEIGQLWNKPVFTVYVSTSRYTYKYMEENDCFTVTAFPEECREKLQYLGTVSGRDEDKLKGCGFTAEYTALGNPIYKDATLAIECKKLYSQQLDRNLMPLEQRQWYDEKGIGVHVMYIGEILHVWKK